MIELQASEPPGALLDEPFALRARSVEAAGLVWRARYRDDDGHVWQAQAPFADRLSGTWRPRSANVTGVAALLSARPVAVDVRVEAPDGRSASRTLTRRLLGEGVQRRRWRDGLAATLHLPAGPARGVALLQGDGPAPLLAAPLLASRGVLTLALASGPAGLALERLAAVPAATGPPEVVDDVPLAPNVGATEGDPAARAAAWDALLARLGAVPRAA